MKKAIFISAIAALAAPGVYADTIVFKDGKTLEVHNVEESGKWVLYTLTPDADSELKRVEAAKVFAIKPEGGEMIVVGATADTAAKPAQTETPAAESAKPKFTEPKAAADNADIIAAYNSSEVWLKKPKKDSDRFKYCTDFITLWGISPESVISDDNVVISFEPFTAEARGNMYSYCKIKVTNKTSQPLYIDLANSFRIAPNGTSSPYFTNSVYTEGTTHSSGSSMNMGALAGAMGIGGVAGAVASGINVGGGASRTATVTSSEQRFLMIPAKASVYMPPIKFSNGDKILDLYECLYFRNVPPVNSAFMAEASLKKWDEAAPYYHALESPGGIDDASYTRDGMAAPLGFVRDFEEAESPKKLSRLITYSTSPDFDTYTTLPLTLYLRGVMGASQRWNVPKYLEDKHFEYSNPGMLLWGTGQVRKD